MGLALPPLSLSFCFCPGLLSFVSFPSCLCLSARVSSCVLSLLSPGPRSANGTPHGDRPGQRGGGRAGARSPASCRGAEASEGRGDRGTEV